MADSLTLDCKGNTCDGALILCPSGDNTTCSIKCNTNSCNYATILSGNDNTMDTFNFECDVDSGCEYVDIQLTSSSIKEASFSCSERDSCTPLLMSVAPETTIDYLSIACTGIRSCQYMDLDLNGTVNDLSINCTNAESCRYTLFSIGSIITNNFNLSCSDTGCYYLDISVPSTSINTLFWECPSYQSCRYSIMTFPNDIDIDSFIHECYGDRSCIQSAITVEGDSTINMLQLSCPEYRSCYAIEINAESTVIDDLLIECGDTVLTENCYAMILNTQISKSSNIECSSRLSCSTAQVTLTSTESDVNYNFDCVNPTGSGSGNGACHLAIYNIYGLNNANLTMECEQYDCRWMQLTAYNMDIVDVNCQTAGSCYAAAITAVPTNEFKLNCNGSLTCGLSSLNISESRSVNIDCITASACNTADFYLSSSISGATFDILCENSLGSSDSTGACRLATIEVHGSNEAEMNVICGQQDCRGSTIRPHNLDITSINCNKTG